MFTQIAQQGVWKKGIRRRIASVHCVEESQLVSLKPRNQVLSVISGKAWLTLNGEDHVLEAGQKQRLRPEPYRAVISPLGPEALVFSVRNGFGSSAWEALSKILARG